MHTEQTLSLAGLVLTFHRTVRVADNNRQAAELPPSLGRATIYKVSDFTDKGIPASWDPKGLLIAVHKTEALWIAFGGARPRAVLIGAGGINAVNGEKLGTALVAGGYCVWPPQPWIDGWKGEDGTVYQFVSTTYEGGSGKTVGEQILGEESRSGGIGIAVFEPKDPGLQPAQSHQVTSYGGGGIALAGGVTKSYTPAGAMGMSLSADPMRGSDRSFGIQEMGVGKGGKINQKIYPDPHGLDAWKETPSAVQVVYLIDAAAFAALSGQEVAPPKSAANYQGPWYGVQDGTAADVPGSSVFAGLDTAFPGDTTNVAIDAGIAQGVAEAAPSAVPEPAAGAPADASSNPEFPASDPSGS